MVLSRETEISTISQKSTLLIMSKPNPSTEQQCHVQTRSTSDKRLNVILKPVSTRYFVVTLNSIALNSSTVTTLRLRVSDHVTTWLYDKFVVFYFYICINHNFLSTSLECEASEALLLSRYKPRSIRRAICCKSDNRS